ncbi:hypothetical protein F0562_010009 [Nyssa sinensis]|uniref:Uncharacterized protein n=1 Tax=Nyssa sinensis TaxID=561372 RepID=A0A5J5A0I2_9ASTE|nr:hypothetical protein F0562_010009 [Nyssa sinensis]
MISGMTALQLHMLCAFWQEMHVVEDQAPLAAGMGKMIPDLRRDVAQLVDSLLLYGVAGAVAAGAAGAVAVGHIRGKQEHKQGLNRHSEGSKNNTGVSCRFLWDQKSQLKEKLQRSLDYGE